MNSPYPVTKRSLLYLVLLTSLSQGVSAGAYYESAEDRFNSNAPEAAPWQEGETALPAFPGDQGLLEFEVGALDGDSYRFYVDEASVSVDADGVVRYTAIVQSAASKVRNVFFEGIRCNANAYKTYAFGTGSGTWKALGKPEWQAIRSGGPMGFRYDLASRYVCHPHAGSYPVDTILRKLRYDLHHRFVDDRYRDF